jgi:cell division septation protein DedD
MYKTLAVTSFVLFAFMAGVIYGAKNQNNQKRLLTEMASDKPKPRLVREIKKSNQKPRSKSSIKADQITEVEKKIAKTKDVPEKKTEKRKRPFPKPIKLSKNKKNGPDKYTVVLATFKSQSSAKEHESEVSSKGLDAFSYTTQIKGKTWHRVGVGNFTLKSTAEGLKKDLEKKKLVKGALISKVPVSEL